jgi:3-deoxy-D-manno-octulosonate 8-phosphate phosphatase (KDO 8-P phosphatase)
MRAQNLVFLGNDLNDLGVMKVAGFGATPIDGHQLLKHHATYVSPQKGGKGFIRDVIEFLIGDELEDVAKNLY